MYVRDPGLTVPTSAEWRRACARGFVPDGSTWSPDTIYGVPIGSTSSAYVDVALPANLHDYRYWVGGSALDREKADAEFLHGLRRSIRVLPAFSRALAWIRCGTYYRAVRKYGASRWRYL
jgi:hypothetical protein